LEVFSQLRTHGRKHGRVKIHEWLELLNVGGSEAVRRAQVIAKRTLLVAIIWLCALYAGDYLWLRYKMNGANSAAALGAIEVRRYWEIPNKSGKFDYSFDPPVMQTCVHSLFPHLGYSPCWYVNRQKLQRVAQLNASAIAPFDSR
jgi:hypothetical protein